MNFFKENGNNSEKNHNVIYVFFELLLKENRYKKSKSGVSLSFGKLF